MKNIQTLFAVVLCGFVLTFTAAASAQDSKQGVATIVRVQGMASYTLESGPNPKWIPLVAGKILMAGSSIKTQPDAVVDMVLGKSVPVSASSAGAASAPYANAPVLGLVGYTPSAEQNTVRMMGEATLKIDTLTISDTGVDTVSDTELDLQKGRIFANVKKLSASSQYLIKIPSGIAGVRGTFFGLDASGWCAVLRHQVDIATVGADGNVTTHAVGQGYEFDPATGQISPVSQALSQFMGQISSVIGTINFPQGPIAVGVNQSQCFISPTSGHHGKK